MQQQTVPDSNTKNDKQQKDCVLCRALYILAVTARPQYQETWSCRRQEQHPVTLLCRAHAGVPAAHLVLRGFKASHQKSDLPYAPIHRH